MLNCLWASYLVAQRSHWSDIGNAIAHAILVSPRQGCLTWCNGFIIYILFSYSSGGHRIFYYRVCWQSLAPALASSGVLFSTRGKSFQLPSRPLVCCYPTCWSPSTDCTSVSAFRPSGSLFSRNVVVSHALWIISSTRPQREFSFCYIPLVKGAFNLRQLRVKPNRCFRQTSRRALLRVQVSGTLDFLCVWQLNISWTRTYK